MTTITLQDGLTLREADHAVSTARLVAGAESPYRNIRREYSYTRGFILGDAPHKRYKVVAETAQEAAPAQDACCALCGEPHSSHRAASDNSAPFCYTVNSRPGDRYIRGRK